MEIPENVKTYELTSSIMWFDENGILCSVPKPGQPPELSREEITKEMEKFREIVNNKKVCMVAVSNPNSRPPSKEERDFIAEQINSIAKAMAIITTSAVSKMIANLFFGLKPPPYPAKMFSNEKDAKEWIKQYL
ncbi:MAG: hypothetical protein K0S32_643 [Bacteroidetes bacterium]|jgi:hypothetical protein|nr:hypothetical protein [Bacteroidota bacterium]